MTIRTMNIFALFLTAVMSIALYQIKYESENEDQGIAALKQKVEFEKEAITVLRAEWSYLNKPERLQSLADRYLELRPLRAEQIATFDDLPLRPQSPDLMAPRFGAPVGGYAGVAVGHLPEGSGGAE